MEPILQFLIKFLGFASAFGLAVLVHELGHFLAAKLFGVHVERFVIGFDREAMPFMPKCIWEKKLGQTTYGLSLMPLGGYVKMVGTVHPEIERYLDGDEPTEDQKGLVAQSMQDQAALYKKPFYQKFIIYSAGVFMNFVLAMAVVSYIGIRGETLDAPIPSVVAWQWPDSWLAEQDIREGDQVVEVNGAAVSTNDEFFEALSLMAPTGAEPAEDMEWDIALVLMRGEERLERRLTFRSNEREKAESLARMFALPAHVEYVMRNRPAHKGGMRAGDTVIEVDGESVDDWNEFVYLVRNALGREITVKVVRAGAAEPLELAMRPQESSDQEGIGQIGVMPGNPEKIVEKTPPMTAITGSPGIVWDNIGRYLGNLRKIGGWIVRGEVNKVRRELGGPVAIAQMAGYHASLGYEWWLKFLIMLNIALGVMNLLPFPVLDGGHLCFAAYEGVFRRPMSPKILVPVLQGGVFLIIGFFILITFSDVFNWLSR